MSLKTLKINTKNLKKKQMHDEIPPIHPDQEIKLKEYQMRKFGKCFQCGENIVRDCKAVCANCGYQDT